MTETLQIHCSELDDYPDFQVHAQQLESEANRSQATLLNWSNYQPSPRQYPLWRDHVWQLLADSGQADKLTSIESNEAYCDLAPHHLLAALSIPVVNGSQRHFFSATPQPEAVRTASRKNIAIQLKDDFNDTQKEEIKSYLDKFHALKDCLISALYCRFYLSYAQYDLFAPKRMLWQLDLPKESRVVLILSIDTLRVGSLEASRDEKGNWSVEFPDFCLPSGSLCYSSWGLELVILQAKEEAVELLPDTLQLLLQFDKYYLQAVYRSIFVQLSLPIEFNQQRSGLRALWGSIRDGSTWQEISYRECLLSFRRWETSMSKPYQLAGHQCFALSVPGRSTGERFLIEVGETEQYSELEWAICTGDMDTVRRIIQQLENEHLLTS